MHTRRTSPYFLRVRTDDPTTTLQQLTAAVTADRPVTDQHTRPGGVSVGFRAADDADARAVTARVLTGLTVKDPEIVTGYGVHRRTLAI